jgi:hypothetical protein
MITKEYAILAKINRELSNLSDSAKKPFGSFYRDNIGNIDKEKSISLEDYIVMQDEAPLGTATIKLQKNKYILQKEKKDGSYLYLPFEKRRTPILPQDNQNKMQKLEEKFARFKPLTKKQLLERVYEFNKDELKAMKITKKTFFASKIDDLVSSLESIGIDDLSQALNFYDAVEVKTKRMKNKIPNEIIEESPFYNKLEELKEKIEGLENYDALFLISKLKKDVEKQLKHVEAEIVKEMGSMQTDSFMTFSKTEEITCENIPKSPYILERFFKKEIDMPKIKSEVFKGDLDLEMKSSFIFYEPCSNLSEVMDRFSGIEFARGGGNQPEYDINEIITLR